MTRMNADKAEAMRLAVVRDPRRSVRSAVVPDGYVHRSGCRFQVRMDRG